jgi:hypothetical protein
MHEIEPAPNRAVGLPLSGTGGRHHIAGLAARGPCGTSRENAITMLDSRPLAPRVGCATAGLCLSGERPGYQAHRSRRPRRWRRVINVLRHDLPRPARRANMPTVERDARYLRCPGRVRSAASADTGRPVAPDAIAVFIDCHQASTRVRRWSEFHRLQPSSASRVIEPPTVLQVTSFHARSRVRGGSVLHLSAICTSVPGNVYSCPGASRGKGSGGVGIRHAGNASRY